MEVDRLIISWDMWAVPVHEAAQVMNYTFGYASDVACKREDVAQHTHTKGSGNNEDREDNQPEKRERQELREICGGGNTSEHHSDSDNDDWQTACDWRWNE